MDILKSNKKEIYIPLKNKEIVIASERDREYLKEYVELEEFEKILKETSADMKIRYAQQFYFISKILQVIVLIFASITLAVFILSLIIPIIRQNKKNSEYYLASCYVLLILILICICIGTYIDLFKIKPLKTRVIDELSEKIEETFYQTQFYIHSPGSELGMYLRIVEYHIDKPPYKEMDYYDYLTYYNPETLGFYKNSDPYSFDPYEMKLKLKEMEEY